ADRCTPDFLQRPQRSAKLAEIPRFRTKIVVDEDAVWLILRSELLHYLLRIEHLIWDAQALGGQIAEPAAVVTAPRGDQARRGEKSISRQQFAPRRGIIAVGREETAAIDALQ